MKKSQIKAKTVKYAGKEVSQVAFGTEHINEYMPEFAAGILYDAAVQNNVFFWDTDNCYGSQPQVAAALKMLPRENVVITSKTYADTAQETEESVRKMLHDLDTPYIDFCLLHDVQSGWLDHKLPALETLLLLKKQGLIHHAGLSTHNPTVAMEAADTEGIEVLVTTFNKVNSYIEHGDVSDMAKALDYAHNKKGISTNVIKVLAAGDLLHDIRGALEFVLEYHGCIDVFTIGCSGLRELRQDLTIINEYFCRKGMRS